MMTPVKLWLEFISEAPSAKSVYVVILKASEAAKPKLQIYLMHQASNH
jgi:hypothetical protein